MRSCIVRMGIGAVLMHMMAPECCHAFVVHGAGQPASLRSPPAKRHKPAAKPGSLRCVDEKLLDGRVLYPGSEGGGWFDDKTTAMPVVLPPDSAAGRDMWLMYYYGRAGDKWNKGHPAFLPTGSSGVAESRDGLRWTRIAGPLVGGAVMHPSEEEGAFDEIQLGVTDVLAKQGGGFVMHYLGGSAEGVEMGTAPGMGPLVGFRMRCLAAESSDGLEWRRLPLPTVDVGAAGEWDSQFASWPRALPCDPSDPAGNWLISYHALQPSQSGAPARWAAGCALTSGRYGVGGPVTKLGRVLEGGGKGAWDERGIGTRHVIHHGGAMYMLFEGVNAEGVHAIGLARSGDMGRTWTKERVPGKTEAGGPVFEARRGNEMAWDNRVVGTPWVTKVPGTDTYRLYYIGTGFGEGGAPTTGIGCAESVGGGLTQWRRVSMD